MCGYTSLPLKDYNALGSSKEVCLVFLKERLCFNYALKRKFNIYKSINFTLNLYPPHHAHLNITMPKVHTAYLLSQTHMLNLY